MLALGLARLAINDLTESGIQPFHSNGRNIHVVVNGEIYLSDAEIEDEKLEDFHQFNGRSDSEVVIPLYQKYGINFLSKLRGEFALVLYDSERQLLVAARDRYGIKPLFWTMVYNRLLVSSEAKAFLPLGWKAEWDVRSLIEEGWLHDERTIFKGVRKARITCPLIPCQI
jgi:asparagine synthase (glutamine-hydrolysing)